MPFGHGPRNCLGMRLAQQEMKMVMATVLQRLRITTCHQTQVCWKTINIDNCRCSVYWRRMVDSWLKHWTVSWKEHCSNPLLVILKLWAFLPCRLP